MFWSYNFLNFKNQKSRISKPFIEDVACELHFVPEEREVNFHTNFPSARRATADPTFSRLVS